MVLGIKRGQSPKALMGIGAKGKIKEWLKKNGVNEKCDLNGEKKLRIINYKSGVNLTPEQIEFVEHMIIKRGLDFEKDRTYSSNWGIYHLTNHIPVFLVDRTTFSKLNKGDENNNPDLLGWYVRSGSVEIPTIYLCIEKINACAKYLSKELKFDENTAKKYLIANVLIHEFAHVLMDVNISHDNKSNLLQNDNEFYRWTEESLANMITLCFSEGYDKFHQFVKGFIELQPDNYKAGLNLFDNGIKNWMKWWEFKNFYKVENKQEEKKNWLAKLQSGENSTLKGNWDRCFF